MFPSAVAKNSCKKRMEPQKMKPRATENHRLKALRQQDQGPSRDFFTVTVPKLTNDSVYLLESQIQL